MKWDSLKKLPVEGSYDSFPAEPEKIKEHLADYSELIHPDIIPLLESVNYDVEEFMLKRLFERIPEDSEADPTFLLFFQLENKPFLEPYVVDILNGYLGIFNDDLSNMLDVVTRLFFCDDETDIWDFVYNDLPSKVGKNLYDLYNGKYEQIGNIPSRLKSPENARQMLEYYYYLGAKQHQPVVSQRISIFSDDCLIAGDVTTVGYRAAFVKLAEPLKYNLSLRIPQQYKDNYKLWCRDSAGNRKFSQEGETWLSSVLQELYQEEKLILNDKKRLQDFLQVYQKSEKERDAKSFEKNAIAPEELLFRLQKEYYPELRHIIFDRDFVEQLKNIA